MSEIENEQRELIAFMDSIGFEAVPEWAVGFSFAKKIDENPQHLTDGSSWLLLTINQAKDYRGIITRQVQEAVQLIHGRHGLDCMKCYDELDLTHPTPADSLNLSKSKGLKPAKDFDPSQVTLCPGCNQMTHTIMSDTKGNEDYCGKCGKVKPADNSDSGRPEKLGGPQTRDFAAEAKQVEKILNRPHEPDYQCTQCSKSPAEHTTAGAGDTPTKTEN